MSNKNTPNKLKERKATVKKTGNKKYEDEFVNNTAMVVDTAASTVSSTPQPPLPNMPMPVASSPPPPLPSTLPSTTPNLLNSKKETKIEILSFTKSQQHKSKYKNPKPKNPKSQNQNSNIKIKYQNPK